MSLKHLAATLAFAVCFSAAANASRVTSNSSYGQIGLSISPCTDPGSNCSFGGDPLGATVTGEFFDSTSQDNIVVYDFAVTNPPSTFTFDISVTGALINSADDIGLFSPCSSGFTKDTPQCADSVPAGIDQNNPGTLVGDDLAKFSVSGTPSDGKFVFFAAVYDLVCDPNNPCENTSPDYHCDPTVDTCIAATPHVTASFETSAVPEPRPAWVVGSLIIALVGLRRWRVARIIIFKSRSPVP